MMKYLILFFLSFPIWPHPVIYQGGWVASSSNMPSYSNNYLSYSATSRWALGVDQWRFTKSGQETDLGFLKLNHLLWRENGQDYQANIYLHGGLGVAERGNLQGASLLGVEADWETRKYYTALKHYDFQSSGLLHSTMTQGRVGVSPYYADFKSLQTWLMLQGMYVSGGDRKLMFTPLLRFFYHNVLWEVGSSTQGQWMLNLMVHF